ncbi:MAG: hypothetical protein AAFU41_04015 [Pseudomonadota bacterium]
MPKYRKNVVKGPRNKRRIITTICAIGILYALILFAEIKLAVLSTLMLVPAAALLIWAFRRPRYVTNPKGRHGLLNADPRPPLSSRDRSFFLAHIKNAAVDSYHASKPGGSLSHRQFLPNEIMRLVKLWNVEPTGLLSDDELRSIDILKSVARLDRDGRFDSARPEDEAMIADWETINQLRGKIMGFVDAKRAQ